MVVNKLTNGKYQSRISYRDANNKIIVKEKRFNKLREAKDFETDFRRELEAIRNGTLTLRQVLEEQLKIDRQHNTSRSVQEKKYNIETYCKDYLDTYVIRLSKKDYLNIWTEIVNREMSISSKNKAIKYVKGLARFAEDYFDFKNNARHLQLIKKNTDNTTKENVWDASQFKLFIENVENYDARLMFQLLFLTGLRIGEALPLLKTDLSGDTLSISKSMESYAKGFKPLKTINSERLVQLPSKFAEELSKLSDRDGDFLIGGTRPLSRSTLQRIFDAAIDEVNKVNSKDKNVKDIREGLMSPRLPYIRIHDLRHSHATILLDKGASIVSVSRRLGHASIQITIDTYTHALKRQEEKIQHILDEI